MISKPIKSHFSLLTFLTGAIALFFSCPSFSSVPEGLWTIPCKEGLIKTQLIEKGSNSTTSEIFHKDRFCKHPSFAFITSGFLHYPSEPTFIDFTYSDIKIILFVDAVIHDFNQRAVCGFTDWKNAEPKTITGKACALFNLNKATQIPSAGEIKFGIFKIENNQLFFGRLTQDYDGSSPDKRPLAYDPQFYEFDLTLQPEPML